MPEIFERLESFGFSKLGDGPNYGRHNISPRKFSIFEDTYRIFSPKVVVEIGSWEGASTVSWAKYADTVICVDTWLGSVEHYEDKILFQNQNGRILNIDLSNTEWSRKRLMQEDGYPSIYKTFADNIRNSGYENKVIPITIDCHQGYIILQKANVKADIVYIDASHDYISVMNDLVKSYRILDKRGHVCGDDYGADVRAAVDEFSRTNNFRVISKENQFIIFDKIDKDLDKFLNIGWKESSL